MQHSQHFYLDTPQTLALRLGAGDMVHVTQGCIWLTLEGHSRDVWLNAHDTWSVPLHAKVWVSAQTQATFTVCQPASPPKSAKAATRAGRLLLAVAA